MENRMKQHETDVRYGSLNNAIAKHVADMRHEIHWERVKSLEAEKRIYPREILESFHITKNSCRCMYNIILGLNTSACYDRGAVT